MRVGFAAGEMPSEELGRWGRRELEMGIDGGGARRLEAWGLAARWWVVGGFNWFRWACVELVGPTAAMFLKQMVAFRSSPGKMVASSSQRTNTLIADSGAMVNPLQDEGVAIEGSSRFLNIAVSQKRLRQRPCCGMS